MDDQLDNWFSAAFFNPKSWNPIPDTTNAAGGCIHLHENMSNWLTTQM